MAARLTRCMAVLAICALLFCWSLPAYGMSATSEETAIAAKTCSLIATPQAMASHSKASAAASTATLAESNYNIRYLIQSGYQAVCFGDCLLNQHTMGGLLVQGNLTETSSCQGIADGIYITAPSFISGYVNPGGNGFNARKQQATTQPLYVGSSNTVSPDGKILNGKSNWGEGYNHNGIVEVNDGYIDWRLMKRSMIRLSEYTKDSRISTYSSFSDWSTMNISAGSNVGFANYGTHKVKIKITGGSDSFTVINILDSGTVYIPQTISYNGRALDQSEEGSDMPIIFNFPNASRVVVTSDMSPSFGHILAPNADVFIEGGNYNGIVICNSFEANGEGHLKNFHGPLPFPDIVLTETGSNEALTWRFIGALTMLAGICALFACGRPRSRLGRNEIGGGYMSR